ncbi:hypothetical protein H0H92_013824, partial [Tricholoma furcatifolium]
MDYILIPARRRNKFSKTSPPIAVRRVALRAAVAKPKVKRPVFARSSSLKAGPSRRRRSPSESCSEESLSSSPTPAPRARRRAASPRRSARRALSSRARMVASPSPVARRRAASPQAATAAPHVPVAQPALRRSQLACFSPPAHSPLMFHEEGIPNHPVSANEMLDIGRRDFLR